MKVSIKHLDKLQVIDSDKIYYGGSQDWYYDLWQRKSGCGPCTCTLLFWYLANTRKEFRQVLKSDINDKKSFLNLMREMFRYVTPTFRGVHTSKIFTKGAVMFAKKYHVELNVNVLDVSAYNVLEIKEVSDFLINSFENDLPVAFLNLSKGSLKNLDSWHWVCLISIDTDTGVAQMCDQGEIVEINVFDWLESSKLGGAFVSIY